MEAARSQIRQPLVRFIATGAGLGYSPFAPGTVGSAGCAVLLWFLAPEVTVAASPLAIFAAVISTLAFAAMSVWFADGAERIYGHDSSRIVIDEFAGFVVAVLLLPKSLLVYAVAFLLFRAMDIVKPFPARGAEALPGGIGIVVDDLVAGVYTNLLIRLMLLARG
ncbi:MAG: phosphatidylglycerophosphatase A [Candidatus Eisenbacteria bacterium]|nr:phosphatidylglycerophosphatase A [Candidatus Eisenbacteria bacterium]